MRWAGARSAGSPTSWPRICAFTAAGRRSRAPVLERATASRPGRASRRSICSKRSRTAAVKAVWIAATNPADSMPRAERVREALRALPAGHRRRRLADRHHRARQCGAAGRDLGREGRHRHQFRALHLAPARVPRPARRRPAGLVDVRAGGPPHGLGARFRLRRSRRYFSRTCGAVGVRERRRARVRYRRVRRHLADAAYDALRAGAMALPEAGRRRRHGAPVRRRRRSPPRTGAPAWWRSPPLRRTKDRRTIRWCSTPAGCATSGTP